MPLRIFPNENINPGSKRPLSLHEFRKGTGRLKVRGDIQERYKQAVAEIAQLGLLSETQLRDLLMDPAQGYNLERARAYHHTPVGNVESILREGLERRINQNPTSFSERDWFAGKIPESVSGRLPRVFAEIAEEFPDPRDNSNLPTSLRGGNLATFSFPIEEAIKRLSREDAFRILAIERARSLRYPIEDNPLSRLIIRKKTGIDPQRGSNPSRIQESGKLDIPEWALSEGIPPKLLKYEIDAEEMLRLRDLLEDRAYQEKIGFGTSTKASKKRSGADTIIYKYY